MRLVGRWQERSGRVEEVEYDIGVPLRRTQLYAWRGAMESLPEENMV